MKWLLPAALSTALMVCSVPGSAQAWTPMSTCNGNPTAWATGSPNTVWRLSSSYTYSGLTNGQIDAAINGAFNEWGVPGCSEFDAVQSSDTAGNPMDNNNSNNIVGFYENSWPGSLGGSSTLAVTMPSWWQNDCEINEADMVINAVHHDWVIGQPSNWDSADLQSVIAHEAGHWIGFGHNTYAGSTLAATYSNGISERTLTCDDTEGACELYSRSGNACTADRYCDCGVGCNGGFCGGTPTGDDDDSTPTGDDDDDNGGDISGPCSGSSETHYETEPNDWDDDEDVDWIQSGGGDTSLVGSLTCGNNGQSYTGDKDWFVVDFPCTDTARFSLNWKTSSDLDFYIYGSGSDPLYESVSAEMSGPVQVNGTASGRIYVLVMCWDGANASYEFLVDFEPFQGSSGGGDDDDTSSGDDDTSGSDDDDAGSGDDDAGSGDDDAGSGDDDDDDDDSEAPVRRGCDCYSTEEGTFAMTGTGPLDVGLLAGAVFLFGLRRRRNNRWN